MSGVNDYRAIALGEVQQAKLHDVRTAIADGNGKGNAIDAAAWALRQNAETNEKLGTILKSQFSRLYIADGEQDQVRTESEPMRRMKVVGNKIASAFSRLTGKNPWEGRSDRNRAAHATVIAYHETRLIKALEEQLAQQAGLSNSVKSAMTSQEKTRLHLSADERKQIREQLSNVAANAYESGKSLRSADAEAYARAAETLKGDLTKTVEARGQELASAMPTAVKNRIELNQLSAKFMQSEQDSFQKNAAINLGKAAGAEIAAHFTDPGKRAKLDETWSTFKARATDTAFLAKADAGANQLGRDGRVGQGALSATEFYQTFLTQYFGIGPNWAQRTTDRAGDLSILSPQVDKAEAAKRSDAIKQAALTEMTANGRPSAAMLEEIGHRFANNPQWFHINVEDVGWLMKQLDSSGGKPAAHLEMTKGEGPLAGTRPTEEMLGKMAKAIETVVKQADNWDSDVRETIADYLGEMMLPAMELHNKQAIRNRETTQTGGVSQQFAQDLGRVLEKTHGAAINSGDLDAFLKLLPDPRGSKLDYDNRSHPDTQLHPPALAKQMREAIAERLANRDSFSSEEWAVARQQVLDTCAELALPALKWLKAMREHTQQAALDKAYEKQQMNELKNTKPLPVDAGQGKAQVSDVQATTAANRKFPAEIGGLMKHLHQDPGINFSKYVNLRALTLLDDLKPGAKDIEAEFGKYAQQYFGGNAKHIPTERQLGWVQRELQDVKNGELNEQHHIRFRTTDFHQTGLELAQTPAAKRLFGKLTGFQIPKRVPGLFSGKSKMEEIKDANLRSYKFIEAMRRELSAEAQKIVDRHGPSASTADHLDQLRGAALRPLMPLLHAYAEQMAENPEAQGKLNSTLVQTFRAMR